MSCSVRVEGLGFSKEEIEEAVKNRRLLSMEIELGRECNFRCPYCYVEDAKADSAELTAAEILDAIDQGHALGARRIILLGGEPMLHPALQETIRHITNLGMEVEIFTNGSNLTSEVAAFFFENSVKVVLKLNSFDPTVQIQLTGRNWAYDCIHTALKNLLEAGYPPAEKRIAASTIICRQNIGELAELWCWLRDRDIEPYFEMITPQGRSSRNQWLNPEPSEIEALFHTIARIDREKYDKTWEPQPPLVGNKCLRNQFTCLVDTHGNVMPCVGITIAAGNIRERSLQSILGESAMFDDLRHFKGRIKGPCAECVQATDCYGCRGAAYQLTGDYLASDPLCWHNKTHLDEIVRLPSPAGLFAPQRPPMLLVDTLVSVGDGQAVAETRVKSEWPFVDESGNLDSVAYLELLAQTEAVRFGFHRHGLGKPVSGLLLGARNLEIHATACVGDLLTLNVRQTAFFGEFSLLTGTITRGAELLATGEIKVWKNAPAED